MHIIALYDNPSTGSLGLVQVIVEADNRRELRGFQSGIFYFERPRVPGLRVPVPQELRVPVPQDLEGVNFSAGWIGSEWQRNAIVQGIPVATPSSPLVTIAGRGQFWLGTIRAVNDWVSDWVQRAFREALKPGRSRTEMASVSTLIANAQCRSAESQALHHHLEPRLRCDEITLQSGRIRGTARAQAFVRDMIRRGRAYWCPGSLAPVTRGETVTCQCGASFPAVHRRVPPHPRRTNRES